MAKLSSHITFTGSLENLSAYRMRGVDGIILRKKGGPSAKAVKTSASFDNVRRNNSEFSGRGKAARFIMNMMAPVKSLADYNIAGPLNALLRHVQEGDRKSEWGSRSILLSQHSSFLEGFQLNRKVMFDFVARAPLMCAIDREDCSARVTIPGLVPGLNFFPQAGQSLYSMVVALGVVPDMIRSRNQYKPAHVNYELLTYATVATPWHPAGEVSEAHSLDLKLPALPPDDSFTLMVSVGIRYGTMLSARIVNQVKYAGSAKVLRVR
jgi:hypothetical protein